MNDPSEFAFAKSQLHLQLRQDSPHLDLVPRCALAYAFDELQAATGLLLGSLTTRDDDLTQWRLYGDNGQGCVLGIDAEYLQLDAGVRICRILYEPSEVTAALKAMMTVLQEQWQEDHEDFGSLLDFARSIVLYMFTIKHPGYADEREVRVSRLVNRVGGSHIDPGGNGRDGNPVPSNKVQSRKGRYGDIAYIDLPLNLTLNSAIKSIGFGPCVSDEIFDAASIELESTGIRTMRSAVPYR